MGPLAVCFSLNVVKEEQLFEVCFKISNVDGLNLVL